MSGGSERDIAEVIGKGENVLDPGLVVQVDIERRVLTWEAKWKLDALDDCVLMKS